MTSEPDTEMCPKCEGFIEIELGFDSIGADVTCPHCGSQLQVEYDESYDEESGDEYNWFWLKEVRKP